MKSSSSSSEYLSRSMFAIQTRYGLCMYPRKLFKSFRENGAIETIWKVMTYPYAVKKRKEFEATILKLGAVEDRFTWIYKNNYWGASESVSGSGSTIKYTQSLRSGLAKLINELSVHTIFDAPCGDFNWMRAFLSDVNVKYIGADIVQELIDSHNQIYQNESRRFLNLNLITDPFPDADIMICRDCLFHLSYADIYKVLTNFTESNIAYLLTTTHKNQNGFLNTDIQSGDFRMIDLFSPPFNFPLNPLRRIDDWVAPDPEREMCLWTKAQIISVTKQR